MNITAEIERRIQSFVADLDGLVRKAALDAVSAALGGKPNSAPKAASSGRASAKKPAAAKAAAPAKAAKSAPKKGGKRDPKDLEKLVDAVRAHIAQHPGEGVETIGKHMGVKTKELALPIIKLLDKKAITRKGQRRGTRYFPAK